MSIHTSKEIKELEAPQSVLRINKPIQIIDTNYKIELNATYQFNKQYSYVFIINKQIPKLTFLQHSNGDILRLSKVLNEFTNTTDLKQQFIRLLQNPKVIIHRNITLVVIEIIYKFSKWLDIPIQDYITNSNNSSYTDLIIYYLTLYQINKNKT